MEQRLFLITKRGYPKREYLIYLYKINSSIPEYEVWFNLEKKSDNNTLKLIQYCFLGIGVDIFCVFQKHALFWLSFGPL